MMKKFRLEDVAIEIKTSTKEILDNTPIVGLEHLDSGKLALRRWEEGVKTTFTKSYSKNDILFGRRRAYLQKAAIAPNSGVCSGDITVIRAKKGKICEELLPFVIQNPLFFEYAVRNSDGSLSPRVKWEHLKNFTFYLPTPVEQKDIAELLWALEDSETALVNLVDKIDEYRKILLKEIVKSGKHGKISDLCSLSFESAKKKLSQDEEITYIEISSINGENHRIENPTITTLSSAPSSAKIILKKDDVLVSLVRPNLRKIALVDEEYKNPVGTIGFCVVRPKSDIFKNYLLSIVNSDEFTESMISKTTGSTYPTIKPEDVYGYEIVLKDPAELSNINKELDKLTDLYNELLRKIALNKKIRSKIVHSIFTGEDNVNV